MTGREGEGREGGYYDGEYLFDDGRDDDEYDDNNEYDDAEDGRGRAEERMMGESDYDGRGTSFGGVGLRTSIVGPHAAAAVIHDDDVDGDHRRGGGALCPPPSVLSRPAGRRMSLSMSPTAVDGGGTRAFGAWSYAWWRRKVRAGCIHSSGSDLIRCGRLGEEERRDIGGIRWQTMSGWGRRRRRRCAARATATMTTATGEGGGEGEVDMEGRRGRGLFIAVLIIVISIIHSNNTYFIPIPILRASCNFCYL
jgi:hypothetical protein